MIAVARLIHRLDDEQAWRALAPTLGFGEETRWDAGPGLASGDATAEDEARAAALRAGLAGSGHARTAGLFDAGTVAAMADAIGALRREGLHPIFVFAYDAPWRLLGRIAPLVSRALGDPVDVLADFWAWHVDPRRDAGGWSPHRGWYVDVRGEDGLPSLVNTWISLSSATPRNACMHVVPLDEDPAWPGALERRPFDLRAGRAVSTEPGDVLAWSANVLHWGGATDKTADSPRISASFSLARRGWPGAGRALAPVLTVEDRLDLIAEQVALYGGLEARPGAEPSPLHSLTEWAAIRTGMRRLAGRPGAAGGPQK